MSPVWSSPPVLSQSPEPNVLGLVPSVSVATSPTPSGSDTGPS